MAGRNLTAGTADQLVAMLRAAHLSGSTDGVTWLGPGGRFEDTAIMGVPPQPVVIDANWLRSDVLRSFRDEAPTIMLNAANRGSLRLYAAGHVLDEVDEHHTEWAESKKFPADEVLAWWQTHYLPAIRLVEPPPELLAPEEQHRIDLLAQRDPDDVPTATLALVLGAPLVSSDGPATEAVYGSGTPVRGQGDLLALLRDSSNATQLSVTSRTAALIPWGLGSTALPAAARGIRRHPAVAAVCVAVVGLWLTRVPENAWRGLASGAGRAVTWAAEAGDIQRAWRERVQAAAPPAPDWSAVVMAGRPPDARTRALMRTMAHTSPGQATVEELVDSVPRLAIPIDERRVQEALRAHAGSVFHSASPGRWQLGRTAAGPAPAPPDDDEDPARPWSSP